MIFSHLCTKIWPNSRFGSMNWPCWGSRQTHSTVLELHSLINPITCCTLSLQCSTRTILNNVTPPALFPGNRKPCLFLGFWRFRFVNDIDHSWPDFEGYSRPGRLLSLFSDYICWMGNYLSTPRNSINLSENCYRTRSRKKALLNTWPGHRMCAASRVVAEMDERPRRGRESERIEWRRRRLRFPERPQTLFFGWHVGCQHADF